MRRIAVCSWSLRPQSPRDLVEQCSACGVRAVQLWLDPIRERTWRADEVGSLLRAEGIAIVSGMFAPAGEDYSTLESIKTTGGARPDSTWEGNLRAAEGDAIVAARLGIGLVTFHAGFFPHDPTDPERARMIDRIRQIAEIMGTRNVRVALETGQEDATTLVAVLAELNERLPAKARVGVNFDPANMILYGMGEPVSALGLLLPHVMQAHVKDALPTTQEGTWGEERPVGMGGVDWKGFFGVLSRGFAGDLVIERESGEARVEDVCRARALIEGFARA